MRENKIMRKLLITTLTVLLTMTMCVPGTAEAASSKAVKSVALNIGKKKVTKQTYFLVKGKTATLKVSVNPSKAKKAGTAKITVTVKGKNGKKKTSYVKIKVTKSHKHTWKKITQRKYVVDERAWNEDVYEEKWVCYGRNSLNEKCGFYADTYEEISKHNSQTRHAYGWDDVKVGTIHHKEVGHYETVVTDRKCTVCGVLDSQL